MKRVLAIVGPTATGKTKIARHFAQLLSGELLSADSRQVYRLMDIGTGKDKGNDRIWGYDLVNPDEEFSVSHYVHFATEKISEIQKRGNLPLVVGGTGLYIKALFTGIDTISIPRNDALRRELETMNLDALQQRVSSLSPETFTAMNNSDKHNTRRLIRKIEILSSPSLPINQKKDQYDVLMIGLFLSNEKMKEAITKRVYERVAQGSITEVEALLHGGYSFTLPSLNTFGYKEWKDYLQNPSNERKNEAIRTWIHDEVTYVKKQMTWFKKQPNIQWFDASQDHLAETIRERVMLWYN